MPSKSKCTLILVNLYHRKDGLMILGSRLLRYTQTLQGLRSLEEIYLWRIWSNITSLFFRKGRRRKTSKDLSTLKQTLLLAIEELFPNVIVQDRCPGHSQGSAEVEIDKVVIFTKAELLYLLIRLRFPNWWSRLYRRLTVWGKVPRSNHKFQLCMVIVSWFKCAPKC